jgi:cation transport regulator ChaB
MLYSKLMELPEKISTWHGQKQKKIYKKEEIISAFKIIVVQEKKENVN